MLLFSSIVFGMFVGFLTHFWLTLAAVQNKKLVLIVVVAVAVVVAVLVDTGHLVIF